MKYIQEYIMHSCFFSMMAIITSISTASTTLYHPHTAPILTKDSDIFAYENLSKEYRLVMVDFDTYGVCLWLMYVSQNDQPSRTATFCRFGLHAVQGLVKKIVSRWINPGVP